MLVQAKRLQIDSKGWSVDIAHGEGQQLQNLLDTAWRFQVPAMYAVYTGGRVFRRETACAHDATPSTCVGCSAWRSRWSALISWRLHGSHLGPTA
jgi:hypothetical protein